MFSQTHKYLILFLFLFGGQKLGFSQLDNLIFKHLGDIKQKYYDYSYTTTEEAVEALKIDTIAADSLISADSLAIIDSIAESNASFARDSALFYSSIKQSKNDNDYRYKSGFSFGNLVYCKNNEYGENNNPGQTFFGNQLWVGGKSYFNQNLSGSLGVFIQYDFGDNNFPSKFLPIFQLKYTSKNSNLIAGSLYGNSNHNLIEPIYNYENNFTKPIEYGLQYFTQNKLFTYQSWIDWRQFAKIETSEQEIISFGQTLNLHPIDSNHYPIYVIIPTSLLVYHQGGEALKVPQRIQTAFNATVGIRLGDKLNHIRFESHYLFSNDVSPVLNHAFKNGNGSLTNLTVFLKNETYKQIRLVASYFNAIEFYSALGAPLFASELPGKPNYQARTREFAMLRFQYEKQITLGNNSMLFIDLRAEPIYHIQQKLFAFSTGVYLKMNIGSNNIH
jgi:hypothetical protein